MAVSILMPTVMVKEEKTRYKGAVQSQHWSLLASVEGGPASNLGIYTVRLLFGMALLLSNPLEGRAVFLHVQESAGVRVPLHPLLGLRVEGLAPVSHLAPAESFSGVLRHRLCSFISSHP